LLRYSGWRSEDSCLGWHFQMSSSAEMRYVCFCSFIFSN
jgi:hypothetical protein